MLYYLLKTDGSCSETILLKKKKSPTLPFLSTETFLFSKLKHWVLKTLSEREQIKRFDGQTKHT